MDDIDAAFAELEREYETIVIEFITEACALLREETPVDTGHARANWVPSKTSPFDVEDGTVKEVKRGAQKGTRVTSAGAAATTGDAQILSYRLDDGDAFIANNVPYIVGPGSLNDGHSSQRAAGFIESCVARAMKTIADRHGLSADFAVTISGAMQGLP